MQFKETDHTDEEIRRAFIRSGNADIDNLSEIMMMFQEEAGQEGMTDFINAIDIKFLRKIVSQNLDFGWEYFINGEL